MLMLWNISKCHELLNVKLFKKFTMINMEVFQNVTSFWVGNEIIIKFITLKHLNLKFKINHGLVKLKLK